MMFEELSRTVYLKLTFHGLTCANIMVISGSSLFFLSSHICISVPWLQSARTATPRVCLDVGNLAWK
jgi:hypothetical protein